VDEWRVYSKTLEDMKNFLYKILFDYDAGGRLRIFPAGWVAIASIAGLVVVLVEVISKCRNSCKVGTMGKCPEN
jgi:hypothetical protein